MAELAAGVIDEIVEGMTGDAVRLEEHYRGKEVESQNRLRYRSLFESDYNAPDAPETVRAPDSFEGVNRIFHHRGWTDGLPIVPPTRERFEAMLGGWDPKEEAGVVEPRLGRGTASQARGQRGDGRLRAGSPPGGGGRDPCDVRSALQPQGHPVHHPSVHGACDGEWPDRGCAGDQRRLQRDGPGPAGQRSYRPSAPVHPAQRRWSRSGCARPLDDGLSGEVLLLLRGERGREPVGVVARGERFCAGCEYGDRVRRGGPPTTSTTTTAARARRSCSVSRGPWPRPERTTSTSRASR